MEYISYILVILVSLAICVAWLWRSAQQPSLPGRPATKKNEKREEFFDPDRVSKVLDREILKVPTPWGWPGNDHHTHHESNHSSMPLSRFVDRLVSEKKTIQNEEFLLRKQESIRALYEDRYGRASKMGEVKYRKVKPPLLRDPSLPHDQMDNFPSGKVDKLTSSLKKQAGAAPIVANTGVIKASAQLEAVRKPWGW